MSRSPNPVWRWGERSGFVAGLALRKKEVDRSCHICFAHSARSFWPGSGFRLAQGTLVAVSARRSQDDSGDVRRRRVIWLIPCLTCLLSSVALSFSCPFARRLRP